MATQRASLLITGPDRRAVERGRGDRSGTRGAPGDLELLLKPASERYVAFHGGSRW